MRGPGRGRSRFSAEVLNCHKQKLDSLYIANSFKIRGSQMEGIVLKISYIAFSPALYTVGDRLSTCVDTYVSALFGFSSNAKY